MVVQVTAICVAHISVAVDKKTPTTPRCGPAGPLDPNVKEIHRRLGAAQVISRCPQARELVV